jgi:hypothetical protein
LPIRVTGRPARPYNSAELILVGDVVHLVPSSPLDVLIVLAAAREVTV